MRRTTPLLAFLASALMIAHPARALAQLSIPGKLMTYRTVDIDSKEEIDRSRTWESSQGTGDVVITATDYPGGAKMLTECAFANGLSRPSTATRSVLRGPGGELERSDFDTFDPAFYPFLTQAIGPDVQPVGCLGKGVLDLARLVRGDRVTFWMWSDSGLIGATLYPASVETLAIPAGSFEALRVQIKVDLSQLFPRVPTLFLMLVRPSLTIWITRTEPYYILKMTGFGSANVNATKHTHTAIELASIAQSPADDSEMRAQLHQADLAPAAPALKVVDTGSFVQGDKSGRVVMSTASTAQGELMIVHVAFNGLATESRTLIDHRASPPTVYLDDRSYAATDAMVRRHMFFFRRAAFPDDSVEELPGDLYGGDMTLGLVMPRLFPDRSDEARFHVLDFTGAITELAIRKQGVATIALGSDEAQTIHAKLIPKVQIPLLLRPLAYFFIPTFDAYFDLRPPHRLLKFEGPLGPPGAPTARMLADGKTPAAAEPPHPASTNR